MIMNHHNSISHAHTILLRHSGILGVAWPPTVFYFSSKNGSTNHNETFSIVFLTKFLTNSWKEKIIGPFFFDLWMFKTLRGSDDPRLGGWRLIIWYCNWQNSLYCWFFFFQHSQIVSVRCVCQEWVLCMRCVHLCSFTQFVSTLGESIIYDDLHSPLTVPLSHTWCSTHFQIFYMFNAKEHRYPLSSFQCTHSLLKTGEQV